MTDQLKDLGSGASDAVSSGSQKVSSGAQQAADTVTPSSNAAGSTDEASGERKWDALTSSQKKATFDSLPEDQKKGKTYTEWIQEGYYRQKENWMPWVEDMYLRWFTGENKASYATKDTLSKTKVTGLEPVNQVQDGVNNIVGDQVGQGGALQPVGDMVSKEGINRSERGGKDEGGSYGGAVMGGAKSVGNGVWSGAKSAGGYVGGMLGGKQSGNDEGASEEGK